MISWANMHLKNSAIIESWMSSRKEIIMKLSSMGKLLNYLAVIFAITGGCLAWYTSGSWTGLLTGGLVGCLGGMLVGIIVIAVLSGVGRCKECLMGKAESELWLDTCRRCHNREEFSVDETERVIADRFCIACKKVCDEHATHCTRYGSAQLELAYFDCQKCHTLQRTSVVLDFCPGCGMPGKEAFGPTQ